MCYNNSRKAVLIMLIMFRVKNFASFKDDAILDLRPASFKNMKNHILVDGNDSALKTLAIYGKNASGKSNLISALYFYESFIYNNFFNDFSNDEKLKEKMPTPLRSRFLLSDEDNKESEFEMVFKYNNRVFQYGFTLYDGENTEIKEEWLFVDDKPLFERTNFKELNYNPHYKHEMEEIGSKIRNDRLFIGNLDYFANEGDYSKSIVDDIKVYFKSYFNVNFELYIEGGVKGLYGSVAYSNRLVSDQKYRETIEKYLKIADIGIEKIKIVPRNDDGKKRYEIKMIHNVYDSNNKKSGTKDFSINMESSGTIRYFSFIQTIIKQFENGGVFIVDEITARIHPLLTKFLLDLYQSDDNQKAQVIFTTHDISFMNRDQMRRDEIVLIEKNLYGVSTINSLSDFGVRSDASFSKDYMQGKFGAIPVIRDVK